MTSPSSGQQKRELLARLLREKQASRGDRIVPASRSDDARIPLSFAQMRLWLLDQIEPQSAAYTISTVLRLHGTLRVELLAASISEIVRRHEALRTVFLDDNGEPYQVVRPFEPVPLPVIDLTTEVDTSPDAVIADLTRAGAQRPFDLRGGPLFRVALYRKSPTDHVLALDIHHIVSDAWSFRLFTEEIAALYTALSQDEPSPLQPLTIQHSDFCAWERQHLTTERMELPLAYWKKQLSGTLPVIQLPSDRPRQPKQTYRGALHRFYLPRALIGRLKQFSQEAGVTPFMTLFTAFATLIHRYTGECDILIGTAFAGRNQPQLQDLIGFFVNTLPLRVDVGGEPSFAEALNRVRRVALSAYAHQELPFIKLVEHVKPDRDTSYSPVVQTMFVLRQQAPESSYKLPGLTLGRPREVDGGIAKFDLSWSMEEEGDDFLAQVEYNADLFDAPRIERFAGHFVTLLDAALAEPARSIATLPLLAGGETERLLHESTASTNTAAAVCFHRIFEAWAADAPDAIAVVFGDEQITYAQLNERANQLARQLRHRQVRRDVLVGLCLERSIDLIVSILAIFKAGGAYVPIDPALPAERIAFLIEDAAMQMVLVHGATRDVLAAKSTPFSVLDVDALPNADALPDANSDTPAPDESASQLAYVIYTSGSTGTPKGVELEHAGLHNMLGAQLATFAVTRESRVLQFASISFDASIFEIVMALGAGATLVLSPRLTVGRALAELIERHDVTHVTLPPSVLAHLPDDRLPTLQTIITAGEACPPQLAERWASDYRFFNAYGPTEATVWSTVARYHVGERITIGRPIANTHVYVLDDQRQLVPVGVPGTLYIGGAGLARGYRSRELTSERFIDNPFGPPGTRLYNTGDLARYLEDGNLEFLGRRDDQVKVRGFRIELDEISSTLLKHPGVREAVVLVKGEGSEDRRLWAYYVADAAGPSTGELRSFLKQKLPSYMVPSAFVAVPAFPLTTSNKVDRQALTLLEAPSEDAAESAAPSNAVEEIIANIWAEALGVNRVGVHDNFFNIGGHSLQAAQVAARVGDAFSCNLPLSIVFERPTVAGLATWVQARDRERPQWTLPITRVADAASHRTSSAQARLWFLDAVRPGQSDYNIQTVLELRGPFDSSRFCACLQALVARHEILRTQYISVAGVPRQIVTDRALDCAMVSVDRLTGPLQADEAERLALADAQRSFDLANELPIRVTLLQRARDHHVLFLTLHHIAADDESVRILLRDLDLLVRAAIKGAPPALPPLSIQYRDFAEWEPQWLTGELRERQLAYWRAHLADLPPPVELPTDRPRPARSSGAGDSVARLIPRPLVDAVEKLSRREGSTFFMALLAAFETVLYRYSGQEDLLIGIPIANRSRPETQNVVGYFGNTLMMRTLLAGTPTFRQLLARVRKVALEAYDHADIPLEELVEQLGLTRQDGHSLPFRILFGLQDAAPPPSTLGDLALTISETDNKTAKCDVVVLARHQPDGLLVRAQYSTDVLDAATLERLLAHLERVLALVAEDPDRVLPTLPLLTDEELTARRAWNAVEVSYPHETCVHRLFAAQAKRTPHAVAVVWQDRQLTYAQLDQRANQLAHHLQRLGIDRETPVGLYMDRSIEMVVSVLAILKAGGVYVPLDPSYPRERIAFMLSDAAIRVVLIHARPASELPPCDAAVIDLGAHADALLRESTVTPPSHAQADDLAYIIYTSGSTGTPKGVAVSHRAINRLVCNTNYIAITPDDRVAQVSNISFDAATFEIWGALLHGARLVGIDKDVAISPSEFVVRLAEQQISVLFLTTALFNLIANTVPSGLASVRNVLFGGEAVDCKCVRTVLAHGRPERLLHVYGPTESTTFASWHLVDDVAANATTVPIGKPIANTELHLLDAHRQPVPVGVPGEIYIGGPGLARGYVNRAELTDERFVPHPWRPHARLYRTGDLARHLPDGSIEFLGRRDQQIKLRGFRIELGEIEVALRKHPAIADAAVLVHKDPRGHKRLAAYVVMHGARLVSSFELRQSLARELPRFMVPSTFTILDALPLTPNGKVDRARLLLVKEAAPDAEPGFVAPQSELEKKISAVWREVLNVDRVGVHDNFFDLGGSSLLVARVLAKLNGALGTELAIVSLFQYPTISSLATFIGQTERDSGFTRADAAATAMRASRTRQAQRRRKLNP